MNPVSRPGDGVARVSGLYIRALLARILMLHIQFLLFGFRCECGCVWNDEMTGPQAGFEGGLREYQRCSGYRGGQTAGRD